MTANRITAAEWKRMAGKGKPVKLKLAKPPTSAKKPRKKTPLAEPWFHATYGGPYPYIEVLSPLRLKSLNKQENGFARHKRVRHEHATTGALLNVAAGTAVGLAFKQLPGPWLVTLARLGPVLLDDDNNYGALKAQVDCVAKWLGVSDAPSSSTKFVRLQEKSTAFGVRIRIEPKEKS